MPREKKTKKDDVDEKKEINFKMIFFLLGKRRGDVWPLLLSPFQLFCDLEFPFFRFPFNLIVKFASSLSGNYFFFPQEKAGKRTNTIRNFARPTKTFSQSFGLGLRRKKGKARKAPKLNFSACGKKARFLEKEGEGKGRGR